MDSWIYITFIILGVLNFISFVSMLETKEKEPLFKEYKREIKIVFIPTSLLIAYYGILMKFNYNFIFITIISIMIITVCLCFYENKTKRIALDFLVKRL